MSRLGCEISNMERGMGRDLKSAISELLKDRTVSIDSIITENGILTNAEWLPLNDKVKISVVRKKIKLRKIIGNKQINLEDFLRQLIYIINEQEHGRRHKLQIGFSWMITDENNGIEYVSCRKSKLIDDWLFKIDFSTKSELLTWIRDMNLDDFNGTLRQAVDDHVFEDYCDHKITDTIMNEDVWQARETIFANKKNHLRCSGRCHFKTFKSAVAMYVEIEQE